MSDTVWSCPAAWLGRLDMGVQQICPLSVIRWSIAYYIGSEGEDLVPKKRIKVTYKMVFWRLIPNEP